MAERTPLNGRRPSETFEIQVTGLPPIMVGFGYYFDGKIGEVFTTSYKIGTQFDIECSDAAVLISLALQHGVSASTMLKSMNRTPEGEPVSVAAHILEALIKREKEIEEAE